VVDVRSDASTQLPHNQFRAQLWECGSLPIVNDESCDFFCRAQSMLASPLSPLLQSARPRDGMTLGVQLTFHGCDYDGESNKGVDLRDMAVRGPRDDKIERLEIMMERLRELEGGRRFCKGDVEISWSSEVEGRLAGDDVTKSCVGRDCF